MISQKIGGHLFNKKDEGTCSEEDANSLSGQRIFISVTWTPLEEGKVRELVTFIINGIVKHQAVLLGVAEQPLKKKKSLWDTIKKKNSSETPASMKVKKSTLKVKNVNKTFQVSQKVDRLRSPLQPCDNQNSVQNSISPGNDSLIGSENKLPISPIAPMLEEHHNTACTPLAMRRSTTFSDIAATVNEELLPEIDSCNVKKFLNEHSELKSESEYSSIGLAQLPSSNNEVILNCTLSPVCTPEHSASVPVLSTRRILSPDSFVNDSYPVGIDIIEQAVPILSPDQFVKDSLSDKQLKTPKLEAALISSTAETYIVKNFLPSKWKNNGDVEVKPHGCIQHKLNEVFEVHNVESQVLHYDKPKENPFSFPSTEGLQTQNSSRREQSKKRPVLSATIIKNKPDAAEEKRMETLHPKSKKCLNKAIMECVNVVPVRTKAELSKHLPVIGPISAENKCQNDKVNSSPTGSTSLCRKRKSEIYVENSRVTAPVSVEEVERKRTLTSSMNNKTHTTVRPSAFKPTNRERVGQRRKAGSSLQKASKTTNRISKPIPGLAQSHLTFVKPLKTVIPRHPMPFAAKNMFYDERWKEKQQRGFTWWLNFVLTPDDFSVKTNTSQVNAAALILGEENHHKSSVPKAPTKDEASLKAYTAHRKLNKLRRDACRLFTSEAMVKAIKKLEVEIETRRLLVRRDRHLWKDVGERQKVLNWLLSYNPLWLRIGLETVYGELIALESNSDVMSLAIFILNRLLWNPDIAAEYRHPTVPHLYREGHEEALSKFTLKKLLLLVCFLDCAKQSRMIDHDPCLFCKDAEFKASKDLLLAFSRDFLSGEGDLSRHLAFLGLPVSHIQTPLDEFDFAVTNLAVDLQCGIRLVRTMELLTKNWNLSKQLRVPAISRLQKMHNVDIALNVLKERGIHLKDESGSSIDSRDIVDRHRERTLALLWKIVFAFQVDIFLNVEQLKEEIEFLKNAHKRKTQLGPLKTFPNCGRRREDNSSNSSCQSYSENVKLLMAWVNAVCAFYNIKVENFTVCFSDGRVLCHLIHHYHPCYMPLEAVCQRTTQTVECSRTHTVGLNSSSSSSSESDTSLNVMGGMFDETLTASVIYKELLDNERRNFQLINAAVSDLGGIPAMIHHSDMSNTIPDEKVVITYLSFLCSRLLDLRQETRAAQLIQSAWRNYRLKREQKLTQERDRAARIIQKSAIDFLSRQRILKKVNAAVFIQKHWRRYLARKIFLNLKNTKLEEAKSKSATVIQAYWRRYSARKRYLQLRHYVVFVQARIRMVKSVAAYKRIVWATVTIQSHLRASKLAKKDRQRYEVLKSSALTIQSAFRRWRKYKIQQKIKATLVLQAYFRKWQSSKLAKRKRAALVIQSWYRMHRDLKQYRCIKGSVIKIQAWYRCQLARRVYQEHRAKIVTIQQYYRAYKLGKIEREYYLRKHAAVIVLQAAFRGMKARELHRKTKAVCVVQSLWRMKKEKLRYLQLKKSVIALQSHVRRYQQQKRYKEIKNAASVIQTLYRAHVASKKAAASFQRMRLAAIVLQSAYRGMEARKKALILRSVIKIQSSYRAYIVRKRFKNLKDATVKIQSFVKMKQAHKHYCALKEATLYVQRRYRSHRSAFQLKEDYRKLKEACIRIQAVVRGYLIRKQIQRWREMAVFLQARYRMRRDRKRYLIIYSAAIVIQKHYRAYKNQLCQRQEFLQVRKAAVCLQAAYRGYKARKKLKLEYRAAVKIQTAFRAHAARMKYKAMFQASIVIQRWYRTYKTGNRQRLNYLMTRAAVLSLQAAFRGWKVRKQIRRQCVAATKIQSAFRKFIALKKFRLMNCAVLTIQKHYRASVIGQKQRQEYIQLRNSVVCLQAIWRGKTVRKTIRKKHDLATIIQSYYRMHVHQLKYKKLRQATLVIQKCFRAYFMKKKQRAIYLKTKAAVLVLQSAYRGMTVRKQLNKLNKAATTIQAAFKSYLAKKDYKRLRSAVIVVQRHYRAIVHARCQNQKYLSLKQATVKVQAIYRGVRVRRQVHCMHQAAICIQATFKMHCMNIKYQAMRMAAIIIQRQYRAFCLGKVQRKKYLELKKSTVILQAACRGMKVRQDLKTMHQSAAVIQSYYRMHKQQRDFRKLLFATRRIQLWYRACKERNTQVHNYIIMKSAALRIQAAFRGMKTRRLIRTMSESAELIQRRFRTFLRRKHFLSIKTAATVIQRKYRATKLAKIQRKKYLTIKNSALVIQASYRGMKERQRLKIMHVSAIVIQSSYHMYVQRRYYKQLCWAVRVTQQRFRAKMVKEADMENYAKIKKAVICLQSSFRAKKARQLYKTNVAARCIQSFLRMRVERRRFLAKKAAAIKIQSMFRCQRTRMRYKLIQSSAVAIQRWYRACRKARLQKAQYSAQRQATVIIQSAFRGMKARKIARQIQAASKIQSFLQMAVQRRKFIQLRTAAITLQAYYLMHKTKSQYTSYKKAAIVLQRCYRSHLTVKYQRMTYLQTRRNIIIVQARIRGFLEKKRFHRIKESTIKIQAFFRGFIQRQKYLQCKFSAVLIQQHYRAHQMRNIEQQRYHQMKRAAIRIQTSYRGYKARQRVNRIRAAQVIQAWFRGCRARKEYASMLKAIRVIQSHFKTKQQRTRFLKMKFCAITIQRRWRATLTARMIQHQFLATKNAAVKIQLAYRQYRATRLLKKKLKAACLIQKAYRGFKARRKFLQQKTAAVIIQKHLRAWQEGRLKFMKYNKTRRAIIKLQAFIRGYLVRKKISEQKQKKRLLYFTAAAYHHISAIKIQRVYRIHRILKLAQNHISSVLIIQRWFRAKMQQKRFRGDYQRIIQLQRVIRSWLNHRNDAAAIIQRNVRRFLACTRRRKFAFGIIKFQALWRGYSWRKNNDTAKTKALRRSLEKANEKSKEENKLCNRTAIAIEYLLKYKHLSYILAALKHLEVATRLSPLCCENMAQSRAIFTIFVLIRSCNRSVPCMDVIRYSVQVLLNVSKYERTTQAVYEVENSIDTLLDLLQMYRGKAGDKISEKGGSIFTKTCCLLAILSKDSKRALEIRSLPRAVNCIQSLYKLTAHKHKMDAERILVKQKTSTFLSRTSFVPVTPLRIKTVSRIKPDWVLRKDNMQEIVDPLQAILMVMDTLGIACY
ncbi:abnormal spindle-like microcephaly-associated protein [Athene cunicularia]|uniref:abnormal spindle-like microcephaly-associated protein n=1 Tax=Athene cunicularia TaxID=194338 RepID=UPI000EF6943B|nr:abnormal spindle-like microcephaly-associated protein [Athene cunicularia]